MPLDVATLLYKSMSAAERKKADAYAGPNESFPLYANGDHLKAAWDLAGHADNPDAVRAKIRAFAEKHGLTHLLPETAMKKAGITIAQSIPLMKSWYTPESEDVQIEGWMSTPDLDLQKMIIEPEAFLGSIDDYFNRRAPLSFIHNDKSLPAGHLQKAAIIRDGQVLKTAQHPTDPADFEDLPVTGSGVWVRGVVNDPVAGTAIRKGNVGSFSWIGHGREYEPLPGNGKRFTVVEPLIESTVAPYPVNTKAVIKLAKAFGLEDETQEEPMNEEIMKLLAEMNAKLAAQAEPLKKGVSEEEMAAALQKQAEEFKSILAGAVAQAVEETEAKLTKAFNESRQGQGRQGVMTEADERDADPVAYLIKASRSEQGIDDPMDRNLVWKLTHHVLVDGLRDN